MSIYAIMIEKEYHLKEGTKTVYVLVSDSTKDLTEEQYKNITSKETQQFFRRLGGSEYASRGYTSKGYKVTELISKNPDRTIKKVRSFNLNLDYNGNKL